VAALHIGTPSYYNLEHPAGTAGEQLRFSITLLYPR
jgi:hypothetical protein